MVCYQKDCTRCHFSLVYPCTAIQLSTWQARNVSYARRLPISAVKKLLPSNAARGSDGRNVPWLNHWESKEALAWIFSICQRAPHRKIFIGVSRAAILHWGKLTNYVVSKVRLWLGMQGSNMDSAAQCRAIKCSVALQLHMVCMISSAPGGIIASSAVHNVKLYLSHHHVGKANLIFVLLCVGCISAVRY